jgi:hypothetical protein
MPGTHTYMACAGAYPVVCAGDQFDFTITPATASVGKGLGEWNTAVDVDFH